MKLIQWFPGHMTKALRMMEENLKLCDGAVVVLDARCPKACINRKHTALFTGKPTLYVLNKADLVPEWVTKAWQAYFKQQGFSSIAVSMSGGKDLGALKAEINALFAESVRATAKRGSICLCA